MKKFTSAPFISNKIVMCMFIGVTAALNRNHMPIYYTADLVTSIKNYFSSKCVFLIYFDADIGREATWELVQLQKKLMEPHLQVATMQITMLKYMIHEYMQPCNKPLYVISATTSNITRRSTLTELSKWNNYHRMKWLLFLSESESLLDVLEDANIALNWEFVVAQWQAEAIQLTEVYRVHETLPLQAHRVGNWSYSSGLQYTTISLYERRSLKDVIIRATVEKTSLLTDIKMEEGRIKEIGGLYGKIWSILEENLQFKTVYDSTVGWGNELPNGSWNGMIRRILNGDLDVAISDFHLSTERERVVDYLMPIVNTSLLLYVREPDMQVVNWSGYLAPFRLQLWVVVALAVLLLSAGITAIYHIRTIYGDPEPYHYTFCVSLFCILGIFCSQGHATPSKSWSYRTLFLTSYLTALVTLAVYSGALISSLTIRKGFELPFHNYEDLLHLKTFEMGLSSNTILSMLAESSSKLRNVYEVKVYNQESHIVKNAKHGFDRLCSDRKYTYMEASYYFLALRAKGIINCEIVAVPETTIRTSVSMVISKKSHYQNTFNYKLLQMISCGIVSRYKNIYWNFRDDEYLDPSNIVVEIETVVPLLVFLGAGIFVSILLLFAEFMSITFISDRISIKQVRGLKKSLQDSKGTTNKSIS